MNTYEIASANDTNPIVDVAAWQAELEASVDLSLGELAARGGRVTRVRFLTDRSWGYRVWDCSYVMGELRDGTPVRVYVTGNLMGIRGHKGNVKGELIAWAKEERVFAKGLGLLDEANWSVLYG